MYMRVQQEELTCSTTKECHSILSKCVPTVIQYTQVIPCFSSCPQHILHSNPTVFNQLCLSYSVTLSLTKWSKQAIHCASMCVDCGRNHAQLLGWQCGQKKLQVRYNYRSDHHGKVLHTNRGPLGWLQFTRQSSHLPTWLRLICLPTFWLDAVVFLRTEKNTGASSRNAGKFISHNQVGEQELSLVCYACLTHLLVVAALLHCTELPPVHAGHVSKLSGMPAKYILTCVWSKGQRQYILTCVCMCEAKVKGAQEQWWATSTTFAKVIHVFIYIYM